MKLSELTKIPRILGVGLASSDGFVIDSQFTIGYDAEKSAAMAAQVVNRIKKSLEIEKASAVIYTQNNVFFVKEIEDGIFFAICRKNANLGLIKVKIDKIK